MLRKNDKFNTYYINTYYLRIFCTFLSLLLLSAKIKQAFPVLREPVVGVHDRLAAVLVILFSRQERTQVLMIKRAGDLKRHAGEISFPGGMFEAGDVDLLATALRETREELRMEIESSAVIGRMSAVTTATGIEVMPFVAVVDDLPRYEKNADEVDLILEIPLAPLLMTERHNGNHKPDEVEFHFDGYRIWGASARILREVAQQGMF